MNKETLARAKELEEDIRQMESALSYYKRGRWSHWDINDRASSFHFEFCKNWSHRDADMQDLPTWLNKPLMEVMERELERCKTELETLGTEQEGNPDKTVNGLHASSVFVDEQEQPKKKTSECAQLVLCAADVPVIRRAGCRSKYPVAQAVRTLLRT